MKHLIVFWLLLLSGCQPLPESTSVPAACKVYFSPRGGCTEAVVDVLARATNSVVVQAYSFTSAPIAKALVEAQRRGLQVAVGCDKSQRTEKYSSADSLNHSSVATSIDAKHAIAHHKTNF